MNYMRLYSEPPVNHWQWEHGNANGGRFVLEAGAFDPDTDNAAKHIVVIAGLNDAIWTAREQARVDHEKLSDAYHTAVAAGKFARPVADWDTFLADRLGDMPTKLVAALEAMDRAGFAIPTGL